MPHVQITWVEGRTPEQKRKIAERVTTVLIEDGPNARIFTYRFTMFRQRIMPKRACWWWTKSARRKHCRATKIKAGRLSPELRQCPPSAWCRTV